MTASADYFLVLSKRQQWHHLLFSRRDLQSPKWQLKGFSVCVCVCAWLCLSVCLNENVTVLSVCSLEICLAAHFCSYPQFGVCVISSIIVSNKTRIFLLERPSEKTSVLPKSYHWVALKHQCSISNCISLNSIILDGIWTQDVSN